MASYGHMLIIDISSLFFRLLPYITGMLQLCYNYVTIILQLCINLTQFDIIQTYVLYYCTKYTIYSTT